jgi:hypothetical protein
VVGADEAPLRGLQRIINDAVGRLIQGLHMDLGNARALTQIEISVFSDMPVERDLQA